MSHEEQYRLTIDPEFAELICPLPTVERRQLEASLLTGGCLDPIIVWSGILIDGRDRYEICAAHGIPFPVVEKEFSCREEAAAWICARQLGRSDLTDETRKYLIGLQFDSERIANERKFTIEQNQYGERFSPVPDVEDETPLTERQLSEPPGYVTARRIADENQIAPGTVWKYAHYAKMVHEIRRKVPEIVPEILLGRYKISHENLSELADLSPDEIRKVIRGIKAKQARPPHDAETRYAMRNMTSRKMEHGTAGISVKDMPGFDPDAEVTGLTLTIPSWISSMERCRTKTRLERITPDARKKLYSALSELSREVEKLKTDIGGDLNE